MKNTFFIYDSTIFVTAKARGIDAEREKEKCISTLNSSSYVTMYQEKNLEDRPKSAKTSHFGQNDEYLTNRLYEQFQTNPARRSEMKRLPWSIPKSHTRLLRKNWNKTTFQIHIFARIPVQLSSL